MKTLIKTILPLIIIVLLLANNSAMAHCDSMEGPVIKDAKLAIDSKNVNYILKWVPKNEENEIKESFGKTMKVRELSKEAQELADKSFFETLVRIHRAGEGVAYTGIKPVGFPIDEKILAADKAIETNNISGLLKLVPEKKHKELKKKFAHVTSLMNFDVNNVDAGREYVEAYVHFFHFAEAEANVEEHKCGHTK